MIKAKGNSGANKSPKPSSMMMFKGIKNLVGSGPGMKKMPDVHKLRPETKTAKIDAGNVKRGSGKMKMSMGPKMMGSGHKGIHVGVHGPEPAVKRDSASVLKPHAR